MVNINKCWLPKKDLPGHYLPVYQVSPVTSYDSLEINYWPQWIWTPPGIYNIDRQIWGIFWRPEIRTGIHKDAADESFYLL